MTKGSTSVSYEYNDSGIRTSKTVNGVKHTYTLNGSQIVTESWTQSGVEYFIVYLYDESGAPIGMQYRTSNYAWAEFDNFYFEKNLFGDIVAIYNEAGTKIGYYKYDAWGACTATTYLTSTTAERNVVTNLNPFRYRGYYYDTETGFYYLQSRYYNPQWGRFLNADGYINANGDLIGFNMYAYCSNNPVMYTDPTGETLENIDWENLSFLEKRFWELICLFDSVYFNAGVGIGLAGAVEKEGLSIEATLHRSSICLKKDAGRVATFAKEEERTLNVSALFCNFQTGAKRTCEMDGTEYEEEYYPTLQPKIGYSASIYFFVGFHLEFGIDLDNYARKRFDVGIALE